MIVKLFYDIKKNIYLVNQFCIFVLLFIYNSSLSFCNVLITIKLEAARRLLLSCL